MGGANVGQTTQAVPRHLARHEEAKAPADAADVERASLGLGACSVEAPRLLGELTRGERGEVEDATRAAGGRTRAQQAYGYH